MKKIAIAALATALVAGCGVAPTTPTSEDRTPALVETRHTSDVVVKAALVRPGVFKVAVKNKGDRPLDVNSAYFKALDTSKTEHQSLNKGAPSELTPTMLEPGTQVKGLIFFDTRARLTKLWFTDPLGDKIQDAEVR